MTMSKSSILTRLLTVLNMFLISYATLLVPWTHDALHIVQAGLQGGGVGILLHTTWALRKDLLR